jgi:hypothetical protein
MRDDVKTLATHPTVHSVRRAEERFMVAMARQ